MLVYILHFTVHILLSPLSEIGIVKKHLKFGWDFNLDADYTKDNAKTMASELLKKLKEWNTKLKSQQSSAPFCMKPDCSDVTIKVTAINKDYRINIEINSVA